MTNLVLQSFDREYEYKRAVVTILSFFAHSPNSILNTQVLLFTDNPEYFKFYLEGLPIQYINLTVAKIKQMRGEIDFLHRMKIAMIEEAFHLVDGDILYADSDTFFIADPASLMNLLGPNKSFMHLLEYKFETLRNMPMPSGATFRSFLKLIESKNFKLSNGDMYTITPEHASWNAGVMFLHKSHSKFIPDVYALTEQIYPSTQNHASEQYAFSVILQTKTQLTSCDQVIFHYWHRIKKEIMDRFLDSKFTTSWEKQSMDKKLSDVKEWTQFLPSYFENHVLSIRDIAVQAFNENKFKEAYKSTFQAIFKFHSGYFVFLKDVLYHTKRRLLNK